MLLVKAVKVHKPLKPKFKGILSVDRLKGLMSALHNRSDAIVYPGIC